MTIAVSGPLFDGRADRALDQFADDLQHEVARQAFADVMTNLNESIKHPTPYYETQVNVRDVQGASVVNDRGISYGPWLEGVGSRNFPKTRFKGYASFRRAVQRVRGEVPRISQVVLRRHIGKMGG